MNQAGRPQIKHNMRYYQVKPESDQIQHSIRFKTNFFVARELYTEKEVQKGNHTKKFVEKHFQPVELNPKKTFFLFGARFTNAVPFNRYPTEDGIRA
jgi:hypothetical protein